LSLCRLRIVAAMVASLELVAVLAVGGCTRANPRARGSDLGAVAVGDGEAGANDGDGDADLGAGSDDAGVGSGVADLGNAGTDLAGSRADDGGIVAGGCGDGVRDPGEECDDGNRVNLDGCSRDCRFELVQRTTALALAGGSDADCAHNAIGNAMSADARFVLNTAFTTSVGNGGGFLVWFSDLHDPAGTVAQSPLTAALFTATPMTKAGYSGSADLDWWYAANPQGLGPGRIPTAQITGSLSKLGAVEIGPANLTLLFSLAGDYAPVTFSHLRITMRFDAASPPSLATGSAPPGHVAGEHLDPALTAVGKATNGVFCGNVSAFSLSQMSSPFSPAPLCPAYQSDLDWLVGGCLGSVGVSPIQPDQSDPTAPLAGDGPPYQLSLGGGTRVSSCRDKSGAVVDLTTCLKSAAYSSYFTFATDRVIVRE
jgi:cysteine-rich repeat protein